MPYCAVTGCCNQNKKTKGSEIKYYSFPKSDVAKDWIAACKRKKQINLKNASICSVHFEADCFEVPLRQVLMNYTPRNSRHLKPDAIPTINVPFRKNLERAKRIKKRKEIAERRKYIESVLNQPKTTEGQRIEEPICIIKTIETFEENQALLETCKIKDEILSQPNQRPEEPISTINSVKKKQTSPLETYEREIAELKQKVEGLTKERDDLRRWNEALKKNELIQKNFYKGVLSQLFSPGQILRLLNPHQNYKNWSPEDISAAMSLQSVSVKAYQYLQARKYPLPGLSTLRKYAAKAKKTVESNEQ